MQCKGSTMKQIKMILMATLLTLTANAGWKSVKTLGHYGPKAFTLKQGVQYVELRKYSKTTIKSRNASKPTKEITTVLRMYQTPPRNKRVFKRMPMKKRYAFKKGEWGGLASVGSWYHNGFMLDTARKTWRLENAKDVIDMVRPIDTPAEIRLVLWLHGDAESHADTYSAKYRKSGKGYIVKEHYIINDSTYGCGDYSYQYKISRSGKIRQKKLLRKRSVKECGGE